MSGLVILIFNLFFFYLLNGKKEKNQPEIRLSQDQLRYLQSILVIRTIDHSYLYMHVDLLQDFTMSSLVIFSCFSFDWIVFMFKSKKKLMLFHCKDLIRLQNLVAFRSLDVTLSLWKIAAVKVVKWVGGLKWTLRTNRSCFLAMSSRRLSTPHVSAGQGAAGWPQALQSHVWPWPAGKGR